MKTIITIFVLFLVLSPALINAQQVYKEIPGDYGNKWMLMLKDDSTVILICDNRNESYEEYTGTIHKIAENKYTISALSVYNQAKCRAVGDSSLYITVDSTVHTYIKRLQVSYARDKVQDVLVDGKQEIVVPLQLDHALNHSRDGFLLLTGYVNPITKAQLRMQFDKGDEYCAELYVAGKANFELIMGKGGFTKIKRTK